jgi:MATE family multidrug resistance protein
MAAVLKRADLRAFASESWSQCWPMTLIMFFDFLVGITDIFIAGRVGKEIQATYGFVIQLYFIFIIIGNAMTVGTVTVIAQLFTSGRKDELGQAIHSTMISSMVAGVLFGLLGVLFTPYLVRIVNIPEELKPYIVPLGRIYAGGLLFSYILINSNGILRACKRVKVSLKTMALVCGLNLCLNFSLVFHTSLGFRGIALATAISVCVGSMVNLRHIRLMTGGGKRFSLSVTARIFSIGWPTGLLQVLWQLSAMAIFLILSTLREHSVEVLAALATGLRIESVIYLPAFAFNMANAVVVGNLMGGVRRAEAFKAGIITAAMGVAVVSILTLAVILNARWIVALLSDNAIVVNESVRYVYVSMIAEPLMAWGIILGGGLNGAGDTKSVMLIVGVSVWLVRVPLCYILVKGLGFGPLSVWWVMNLSQLVMALIMTRRYFGAKWLERGDLKTATTNSR